MFLSKVLEIVTSEDKFWLDIAVELSFKGIVKEIKGLIESTENRGDVEFSPSISLNISMKKI